MGRPIIFNSHLHAVVPDGQHRRNVIKEIWLDVLPMCGHQHIANIKHTCRPIGNIELHINASFPDVCVVDNIFARFASRARYDFLVCIAVNVVVDDASKVPCHLRRTPHPSPWAAAH